MEKTQLKEHLKHYHLGERSAVTSRELETAFGVSGKELRDAVARQNYRKAAKIRKQLDEMDGEAK